MSPLAWAKGGTAEILKIEGDAIEVRSTTPAPPGARVEATLTVPPETRVLMKSHGSRREADGQFLLKGRLIDATKELRERLAALVRD